MAFVNEYISIEDRQTYKFDEIFLKKYPRFNKQLPDTYNPYWTRDRERDVYMVSLGSYNQAHDEDPWIGFQLVIGESEFDFYLLYGAGRSSKFVENPYYIVWDFIRMEARDPQNFAREDVIKLFKEALTVYGYAGMRRQIDNTIVKFNF